MTIVVTLLELTSIHIMTLLVGQFWRTSYVEECTFGVMDEADNRVMTAFCITRMSLC